ncbi:class I SAM-dependent methyltransferase [Streptomyces sp. NBC_00984]|uniref:class I SAM-dependent methyltransferase n=1 Tax=Streptomyces sp. NBC_00984 TaxID=2903700 RepID=UPI00386A1B20|nr:class I SAM-dependent methyltransferase [Streptomyces sp. NBC_00984]
MNLFDSAAPDYARYRPGIPDEAIQLLARTLEGIDRPTLLDPGSGTGQVSVGLLPALAQIGRVDLVDRDEDMLRTASELLRPLLGQSAAAYHAFASEEFTAPFAGYRADLVTCSRAFHWMDRQAALAMADRVTTPGATVAVMGDGSLWTYEAKWTLALKGLIQSYLGTVRRAGTTGVYANSSNEAAAPGPGSVPRAACEHHTQRTRPVEEQHHGVRRPRGMAQALRRREELPAAG